MATYVRGRLGRLLVAVLAAVPLLLVPATGAAAAAGPVVHDQRVVLPVVNANRSAVACASDGASYRVSAHLVSPASGPGSAVTVYVHDYGFRGDYWHFTRVPGYDLATELARQGQTSLVLDRLGYLPSGQGPGLQECVGSEADVLHQVVTALRSGTWVARGQARAPFQRVALAGHAAGAALAELEAVSYGDVDALVVMGWADGDLSPAALAEFATTGQVCARGGERAQPGGPGGYAFFGQTPARAKAISFADAEPAVVAAALAQRPRDPCGDTTSFPSLVLVHQARLPALTLPVLLVESGRDAFLAPTAGPHQRALFRGSRDLVELTLPRAGNAAVLERSHATLRTGLSAFLCSHRLGCPARAGTPSTTVPRTVAHASLPVRSAGRAPSGQTATVAQSLPVTGPPGSIALVALALVGCALGLRRLRPQRSGRRSPG